MKAEKGKNKRKTSKKSASSSSSFLDPDFNYNSPYLSEDQMDEMDIGMDAEDEDDEDDEIEEPLSLQFHIQKRAKPRGVGKNSRGTYGKRNIPAMSLGNDEEDWVEQERERQKKEEEDLAREQKEMEKDFQQNEEEEEPDFSDLTDISKENAGINFSMNLILSKSSRRELAVLLSEENTKLRQMKEKVKKKKMTKKHYEEEKAKIQKIMIVASKNLYEKIQNENWKKKLNGSITNEK